MVLGALPRAVVDDGIVVANGSRDRSAEVAHAAGAGHPRGGSLGVCRRWIVVLLVLAFPNGVRADVHDAWDALLAQYVDDAGRVAYRDIQDHAEPALDAYLGKLAAIDPVALSPADQIAFWLNAYNARVVRGVLDGYDAEGVFARKRFFSWYAFPLAGRRRTLDAIEHDILRKEFAEPRIHFALVCASTSCPKLRREAYRGDRLDAQLTDQTQRFLADPSRNQLAGDPIRLSAIFDWFGDDFVVAAGSVLAFVRRYANVPGSPTLGFLDYDWTMNAQPGQRPR